jgi:hypothetical protein
MAAKARGLVVVMATGFVLTQGWAPAAAAQPLVGPPLSARQGSTQAWTDDLVGWGTLGLGGLLGVAGLARLGRNRRNTGDPLANYPIAREPCLPNADAAHTPLMMPVITPEAAGIAPPANFQQPVAEPPHPSSPRHAAVPRPEPAPTEPTATPFESGTFTGQIASRNPWSGKPMEQPAPVAQGPAVTTEEASEEPERVEIPRARTSPEETPTRHQRPRAARTLAGVVVKTASKVPKLFRRH